MPYPAAEVTLIRDLARRYHDLALTEEFEQRRKRWRAATDRRGGERAPVWCRPDSGVWKELISPDSLVCTDPLLRERERLLRLEIRHAEIGDDHIFEPWWPVPAVFDCSTEHTWGLPINHQVQTTEAGGFRYDHPVKTLEDYERVTVPAFAYNPEKTATALEQAQDLLGDSLPVKLRVEPPVGPHLSSMWERLRDMADMLQDLAFHPELVHRVMAKLSEGVYAAQRAAEATGLLTPNNLGPMFCSAPLGEPGPDGKLGLHNLWCGANSQEFQVISPAMMAEFLIAYQAPLLSQYGATWYGCCEDLSQKIEVVMRLPNLRIFVCSYWTNLDKVLEACGTSKTIMWRQLSAHVVFPDDLAPIRKHLEQGLAKLRGHHYQIVLRELETLHGHPRRLEEWSALAKELAEQYA